LNQSTVINTNDNYIFDGLIPENNVLLNFSGNIPYDTMYFSPESTFYNSNGDVYSIITYQNPPSSIKVESQDNVTTTNVDSSYWGNGKNAYLIKYNSSTKSVQWYAKIFYNNYNRLEFKVAVNSSGDVFVHGLYQSNLTFYNSDNNLANIGSSSSGLVPYSNTWGLDLFVVKYNSSGILQSAITFSDSKWKDNLYNFVVDNNGWYLTNHIGDMYSTSSIMSYTTYNGSVTSSQITNSGSDRGIFLAYGNNNCELKYSSIIRDDTSNSPVLNHINTTNLLVNNRDIYFTIRTLSGSGNSKLYVNDVESTTLSSGPGIYVIKYVYNTETNTYSVGWVRGIRSTSIYGDGEANVCKTILQSNGDVWISCNVKYGEILTENSSLTIPGTEIFGVIVKYFSNGNIDYNSVLQIQASSSSFSFIDFILHNDRAYVLGFNSSSETYGYISRAYDTGTNNWYSQWNNLVSDPFSNVKSLFFIHYDTTTSNPTINSLCIAHPEIIPKNLLIKSGKIHIVYEGKDSVYSFSYQFKGTMVVPGMFLPTTGSGFNRKFIGILRLNITNNSFEEINQIRSEDNENLTFYNLTSSSTNNSITLGAIFSTYGLSLTPFKRYKYNFSTDIWDLKKTMTIFPEIYSFYYSRFYWIIEDEDELAPPTEFKVNLTSLSVNAKPTLVNISAVPIKLYLPNSLTLWETINASSELTLLYSKRLNAWKKLSTATLFS
jgi:hypothetical protein